jgi:vancomycin resistance protein YoaR
MMSLNFSLTNKIPKWLLMAVTVFLLLVLIFLSVLLVYDLIYRERVYAGVAINGFKFGGKSLEQTQVLVQALSDNLADAGVVFYYPAKNFEYKFQPIISAGGMSGGSYEVWYYQPKEIAKELYKIGREGTWLQNIYGKVSYLSGRDFQADYILDKERAGDILKSNFGAFENPGEDASFEFLGEAIKVNKEKAGESFDYQEAIKQLEGNLSLIKGGRIEMRLKFDEPQVKYEEAIKLKSEVENILDKAPLTLRAEVPENYQDDRETIKTEEIIDREKLKEWLKPKKDDEGNLFLGLDEEKGKEFLAKWAKEIDQPVKDAKFVFNNGKVSEWQSAEDGFYLDKEATLKKIEEEFFKKGNQQIVVVLGAEKSKITNDNVNDLGIAELVGVGESNFKGSPVNRRHNIRVGADSLNGILIKPGEEFSLLNALGEINGETGYKTELVIREGKTTPEYGGGLCQIGTTMFRLAINTGLPVTERKNHSYRVAYYEPAGTDATIYSPAPDLKFINDTPAYLLLQTRIEGDKLIFEFWGTKDGRQVEVGEPAIYNIVKPGEPKYVETEELKPGEKKKVETAHNGADTNFKRTIEWPQELNKEKVEEVWSSHYVPWREVWMVGKAATSTEAGSMNNE